MVFGPDVRQKILAKAATCLGLGAEDIPQHPGDDFVRLRDVGVQEVLHRFKQLPRHTLDLLPHGFNMFQLAFRASIKAI